MSHISHQLAVLPAALLCFFALPASAAGTEHQLSEITVSGTAGVGSGISSPVTLTKFDVPLMETPASIQVVPSTVIEDQAVDSLQGALENVSGVRSNNNDLEGYIYKIRGFTSNGLFRNGLSMSYSIPIIYDTANVEQVEVLKGPASILFGRIEPGGVINLATKRPLDEPYYSIEQEIGSYQFFRTQWDATGPINDSGSASYRFSGAFQDFDSFRDFQGGKRIFAAPTLGFKLAPSTDLLVDLQYMKNEAQSDTGIPALGNRPAPVPLSRSFQEPDDPFDETESYNIGYELKHRVNDNWSITNRFLYSDASLWKLNVVGFALDESTGVFDRATQHQTLDGQVYSFNLDLAGKFEAWGGRHKLLAGFDYLHDYFDYRGAEGSGVFPINTFNPVYGTVSSADFQDALAGTGYDSYSSALVEQIGVYLQDQITWGEQFHLLVGGRFDNAKLYYGRSSVSAEGAIDDRKSQPENEDQQFSPRLGMLYEFKPGLSGYLSYSKSFGPNNGVSGSGEAFDPEVGIQYEAGVKAEVMRDVFATISIYRITKQNVLTADLSTPDPTDSTTVGEEQSKGIEFDLVGQATDRLSLIANYAYTQTKITQDNNGLQGNQLDNVPTHSGRLFAIYDLRQGNTGWRVGGGFYAASSAAVDRENSAYLPGFVRFDAMASYSGRTDNTRWTAQVNLQNLLDTDYYEGSDIFYNYIAGPRLYLLPAQPFTVTASLKLEF